MKVTERLSNAFRGIVERFSSPSYTEVSASASSTSTNPIAKAVESLNGRYRTRFTQDWEYVSFGNNDDVPEILDKMKMQSPTHSGIITKKAKMVAGNILKYSEDTVAAGQKTRFKAFYKHSEGEQKGIRKFTIDFAHSYEQYGAVPILIKWNQEHTRIVSMKVLMANSVRACVPDMEGNVQHYIVRRTFKRGTDGEPNNIPRRVPTYSRNRKNREELLYVMNPYSGNPIYGLPNYLPAYYFISADNEFGKHIENSVKNGFSPKVLATFIGRNMTKDEKDTEYENFKESFTGGDGETFMLSWVRKKEDAPEFRVLDVANLDRTIDVLSKLNDAKILTAHNVTSPTLFGIMVSGKLGGTGDELKSAYYIFRATETLPNREMMLTVLNDLMAVSGYGEVKFSIEDIDIDVDSEERIEVKEEEPKNID